MINVKFSNIQLETKYFCAIILLLVRLFADILIIYFEQTQGRNFRPYLIYGDVMQSDFVSEKSIKNFLKNKIIGKNLVVLESVGSTNDYLKNLGNYCCENGTVVLAREQTNGKGRLGRSWICKKDESLALSILLRPKMAPSEVSAITPLTGLAVCKALRKFTGMECKIKWPNDIIVGRKKLVGILTEMSAEFDAVDYVVIGVGINVSQADFPKTIADKATSILLETGKSIDKNELSAFILEEIEKTFTENNLELSATALREYTDLCATIGRNVSFRRNKNELSGIAVGIAQNGELKIMLSDGKVSLVNSGEVTVQGIY